MGNISTVFLNFCFFALLLAENHWKNSEGYRSDEAAFFVYVLVLGSFLYMMYQIYNIYKEHQARKAKVEESNPFEKAEQEPDFNFDKISEETETLEIPDFLRR